MDTTRRIKAFCLLTIMLVMMTHNIFPHNHHHHEQAGSNHEHTLSSHHHGHAHDAPHQHHHSHDAEEKSFIDFFVSTHAHATHAHHYAPAKVETLRRYKAKVMWGLFIPYEISLQDDPAVIGYRELLPEYRPVENPFLRSNSLRAPPGEWLIG